MGVSPRASLAAALLALLALLAPAASVGCAPDYLPPRSSVRLKGAPPDATVTIDDQPIAPLGVLIKRGLSLPPGRHRVTVEREGYFPWDRAVESNGDLILLEVQLVKIPE